MKTLFALIKKEFLQIRRNTMMKFLIIGMPLVQLLLLVNAANFDITNLSLAVVDKDNSTTSQRLISKIQSSGYFVVVDNSGFEGNEVDVLLEIPADFESDIYRGQMPRIAVTADAINTMKAGLASSYLNNIVMEFGGSLKPMTQSGIDVTFSQWFNPKLDYKSLMLPGILAILITLIGILLSSLSIVREREIGTIEQLNVTPISKAQFIVGKLFPLWIIGILQLTLGLIISKLVFDLQIVGSIPLLYLVVGLYLFTVLGLGFLISASSGTQTQSMLVALFFSIIFILMSGLFTSTEYMPQWAQAINVINPTAYLVSILRLIVLKGSTSSDIIEPLLAIIIYGVAINLLVVFRYKKVS